MRTRGVLLIVICFAAGTLIFQMSGLAAVYQSGTPVEDLDSGGELEERTNETALEQTGENDEAFGADARGDDSLLGFAIASIGIVFQFLTLIVMFPVELSTMGVPWWAAYPTGIVMQTVALFGLAQFASGRIWE